MHRPLLCGQCGCAKFSITHYLDEDGFAPDQYRIACDRCGTIHRDVVIDPTGPSPERDFRPEGVHEGIPTA